MVASDAGSHAEVIAEGVTGAIVAAGDGRGAHRGDPSLSGRAGSRDGAWTQTPARTWKEASLSTTKCVGVNAVLRNALEGSGALLSMTPARVAHPRALPGLRKPYPGSSPVPGRTRDRPALRPEPDPDDDHRWSPRRIGRGRGEGVRGARAAEGVRLRTPSPFEGMAVDGARVRSCSHSESEPRTPSAASSTRMWAVSAKATTFVATGRRTSTSPRCFTGVDLSGKERMRCWSSSQGSRVFSTTTEFCTGTTIPGTFSCGFEASASSSPSWTSIAFASIPCVPTNRVSGLVRLTTSVDYLRIIGRRYADIHGVDATDFCRKLERALARFLARRRTMNRVKSWLRHEG